MTTKKQKVKRSKRYFNDEEHCTKGCGRSNHVNAVTLGRRGAELLIMLHSKFKGKATQKQMQLKMSDYATISRTRYWGLTEQPKGADPGTYKITPEGYAFLAGDLAIHHTLYQFDSQFIDRAGPMVTIRDVLAEGYETHAQILDRVRATRRPATEQELAANIERNTGERPASPPPPLRHFEPRGMAS